MYAIINGYGVPKNIATDKNYNRYLKEVFSYLLEHFGGKPLIVVPCGGPTDFYPPYRRTEAGEMARWLEPRITKHKLAKQWKLNPIATEVSAIENMLACRGIYKRHHPLYFCEQSREKKMRILAKKIFGAKATVVPIDFDRSPAQFDTKTRKALEKEDLEYSLRALRDQRWRRTLNAANWEKIRILRSLPQKQRAHAVDQVAIFIRRAYLAHV